MPLLLRHLMPLIVIASLFAISMIFVFATLAVFGRMFRRPERELARGPLIEGVASEVRDAPDRPHSAG